MVTMRTRTLRCRKVVGGQGRGDALVGKTRLSFWGGFDAQTGMISERNCILQNQEVAGKVLVFISSKGSSEASRVMAAASRNGKAPAAIINTELDAMVVLACVTCGIPMVTDLSEDPFAEIQSGDLVFVDAERGIVRITKGED
jgi:predicted aconitase with swiveling domain